MNGAYYLAGYAVELALKACIIKMLMSTDEFPGKDLGKDCYTHLIETLVKTARLTNLLHEARAANSLLNTNWAIVKDWTEQSRYQQIDQVHAESLLTAIADTKEGVLVMDQEPLVNERVESGQQLIAALKKSSVDVQMAFWAKLADEEKWCLYLCSPQVDTYGPRWAYEIIAVVLRHEMLWIDLMEIRVLGMQDSLTQGIQELVAQKNSSHFFAMPHSYHFPGNTRIGQTFLKGVPIDGALIYPQQSLTTNLSA